MAKELKTVDDVAMLNDKERIGAQIAAIRKQMGMTQQDLSERCGMIRTTIAKIEAGRFNASIDLLSKVLRPLGGRIEIILSGSH